MRDTNAHRNVTTHKCVSSSIYDMRFNDIHSCVICTFYDTECVSLKKKFSSSRGLLKKISKCVTNNARKKYPNASRIMLALRGVLFFIAE